MTDLFILCLFWHFLAYEMWGSNPICPCGNIAPSAKCDAFVVRKKRLSNFGNCEIGGFISYFFKNSNVFWQCSDQRRVGFSSVGRLHYAISAKKNFIALRIIVLHYQYCVGKSHNTIFCN